MKRALLLIFLTVCCSLLVQCPTPWHQFDNPVDPQSANYIGTPSQDNNGNGIPQYVDVEEIVLVTPAQDASLNTLAPILETYQFKPDLVTQYWVQVATDATFVSGVVYDQDLLPSNECTLPPGILNNNTVYFWRAKAFDGTKWSSEWSEPRSFTIHLDMGVPGSPIPVDGAPDLGDATPDLSWSDVPGAEGYQIQIDEKATMEAPLLYDDGSLVGSSFSVVVPLLNGTYYWRVRIKQDGQWGDWSPTWSFTVVTATEINLKQGAVNIPSGSGPTSTFSFGNLLVGSSSSAVSFTIENQGTADLIMDGIPKVSLGGTDPLMFTVGTQPSSPVAPFPSSTTFTITFSPTSEGAKTAIVSIANNDTDENPYTFTVTGAGTAAEINLKQGATSIVSGSGSYPFGIVLVGTSSTAVSFTVENLGTGDLFLTGSPRVAISGTDAPMFSASAPSSSTVVPSGTASFTVTFSPTSVGEKSATLTIASSDPDEGMYTFTLSGIGMTIPEINLKQGSTDIPSGSGTYGFGSVILGSGGSTVSFTVENSGNGDLNLSGTPKVAISGTDAAMFTVAIQPNSPITPSSTTSFSISFNPTSVGAKTATVTIPNNDADEYSYTFSLTGAGVAPEVNLKQGATNIASGSGSYGFGSILVGSSSSAISFTVENLGTSALNLTGTPNRVAVSGTDGAMFSVTAQPGSPVAPAGSTTFTIMFSPTSIGTKTASVSIANDDGDENPYTFSLTGTGIAPEINLKQGATSVPSGTGSYGFGNVVLGSGGLVVSFTVENVGTSNLNLGGSPRVAIGGTDAALFVVETQPSSPIVPSGSASFTIRFTPTTVGAKSAAVTIASDDADENPYTFSLAGTGVTPEINLKQGATNIASGSGTYAYGNVIIGAGGSAVSFTVENLGTSNLNLNGTPKVSISGTHAAMFTVSTQPGSPVTPAGNTGFAITFAPTSLGPKTATVSLANDDLNENPYTFSLTGTGISPEINVRQGVTNILSGTGSYGFGTILVGSASTAVTFTVENTGTSNLNLSGTPKVSISGTDAAMFVVGTQPGSPVTPAGTTTFAITFSPASIGARTATVTIANDDLDENPYTFGLTGTGISPEINVKQGATNILSGSGTYGFSSVLVGGASPAITFAVENLGTSNLNLSGTPKVSITGTHAAMFTVGTQPGSPVTPAGTTSFTITFSPASIGAKTAAVTIANDDLDENPYTFSLTGTGISPEINLKQGATNIASGTGSYGFGSIVVGSASTAVTFTVENTGTSNLNLSGTPRVSISGTHAAMFAVGTLPGSPVTPAGTTTFTITFSPGSIGAKNATVSIANDDLDENPYTFSLTGTGISPEINLKQGVTNILSGTGSYGFGSVLVGSASTAITFTVENTGTSNLNLNGTPKVSITGTHAAMFTVGTQPSSPVTPAGTTSFTITFSAASIGAKNATVSIANDDLDENPYTFSLTGTGISPEINLKQGATNIASGTGNYGFGSILVSASSTAITFTVENLGTSNLTVSGTPRVAISGTDAAMFVVGTQPATPILPAGSATFTITFSPSSPGAKGATVTIANDDLDENPYTFSLSGTGISPEINLKQGATNIASGTGSYGFGSILVGGASSAITFTVENTGTSNLNLNGTPKVAIGGTDAAMFVVGILPTSPVGTSSSTTFTVTFSPVSVGAKTATVTIANDDLDENPYTFSLTGAGISPEINLKQGAATILSSTGSYAFANVVVGGASSPIMFTIENLGTSNLNLSGTPGVAISGTDAAMFVVGTQPGSPVTPAGTTTFTITFSPASIGAKNATVYIPNDDLDENPYTFSLSGTGISPEINLKQGATNIASGTGNYGFGSILVSSSSAAITFSIENLGTSNLNLGGTPRVAISGTDAAMFVVGTQPGSPVAPAGTTTFTITFSPASIGAKNATVTIANDDLDENPYTFSLTGTGISPEINLKQGATNIASGTGNYGFGSLLVGASSTAISFTVENVGASNLNLNGTPKVAISGTGAAMFSVGPQPSSPVAPAGSVTFTITFSPTSGGTKNAMVTIANDDLDENPYTFSLTGTGISPEINLKQGATNIASGTGSYGFGSRLVGSSSSAITFTVENLGTSNLNLSGTPKVAISGTDAAMFVVGAQPSSPVTPAGTTSFTITFSPASIGAKNATVSIANDDLDENPYTFSLSGTGISPEFNLKQGATNIASGTGNYGFGSILVGASSAAISFTVENLGTSNLTLGGTPRVAISGTHAAMFTVGTQPGSPVAPAGTTTFTITFSPASIGAKNATVTIANDDLDENPYTFSLTGTGISPEINLKQGATNIASGTGSYGFGSLLVGASSTAITFTVENVGTSNLTLSGTPRVAISGTHAAMFTVGTQPGSPVAPAGTTTFTITFSPASIGAKNATVSIINDDLDENPYTFSLTGTGISPEINLKQGATNIASGTGNYGFGSLLVSSSSAAIIFTIENLGTSNLNLSGTPRVAISGTDAAMFVVGTQPGSPVAPAGSATFTITFSPGSIGAKNATVTIADDDLDENPYTFSLTGTGVAPEVNLKQGVTSILSGSGSYDFGSVTANTSGSPITFTIENLGSYDLNLTGTPKVALSGTDAAMFAVGVQPSSPVAPAGSSTFTITFFPTSAGLKSATLSIASNDADENPYVVAVTGTGIVPEMNVRQGISSIASGGTHDFGSVLSGTSGSPVTFTIDNLGLSALNLTGNPKVLVSGADASQFAVGAQPTSPVAAAGTTTFTITFSPSTPGPKTALVSVANDDPDRNPYTFTVNGVGGTAPEINMFWGSTNLPSGGSYGFGNVVMGSGGTAVTFTVENLGTADLNLSGNPRVAISGTDAAMFVVGSQPSSPVAPAGSVTFTITFSPTSVGAKTVAVSIANNDSDENPYTFTLTGTGVTPEINLKQGATNIASGTGNYGFGSLLVSSSSAAITFTIENLGTSNLNLSGTPRVAISGTDAAMFVVGTQPATPILPAGTTTFTITFSPASIGAKNATVTIANDDLDENPYTFSLTGTGISPEINLKQGATNIASGTGNYGFGSLLVSSSSAAITFTIENLGTSNLNLGGTPRVAISGTDAAMFVVGTQPGSPVAPAGTTTFTITFSPASIGAKNATVTIANDDLDENPYTFSLTGTGISPEINVKQGATNIASGTGNYGFGSLLVGASSTAISFTVENLGTSNLSLGGTPRVAISGTDAAMFVVGTQPGSPVAPAGTTTFTITFSPASIGAKNATVTIANDDLDENPYTFSLSGAGISPEINVKQGATNIASGTGNYGFGSLLVGASSTAISFTVENLGTSNLNLGGTPRVAISGTDAAMFVVGTQPGSPVAPAGTTTFTITFSPASIGAKNATVTIANDDLDENPYTFSLSGTGITPEINVKQGATNIASGTGNYGFGSLLVSSSSAAITFTIENLGTSNLNLGGTPRVAISGTDAAMFVVGTQPSSPVAPAGSATFTITFSPSSPGAKGATVTIANDDLNENPYTFSLTGTGISPEINLKQGATNIASGTGNYGFGSLLVGASSTAISFTVENLGTSNLSLSGTPRVAISGTDAAMFVVGTQPGSPVAPAGTTTFTITFSPASIGAKNATVTIANDDLDENPYTFSLSGTGISPEINLKQGATNIPSGTGNYGFGSLLVGASSTAISFTVENLGTSNLNLSGTPRVAISGTDAAMFGVGTQPGSPVAPAGTTTFTITFSPASIGAKNATVTIANDDLDENPYTFSLSGTGISPEINLKQGATNIASGTGNYGFGSLLVSSSSAAITFTIENLGTSNLNLGGTPRVAISGTDAAMFVVGTQPSSPVAPAGSATFTITFSPSSPGAKGATVTIANDDLNENPYTFSLTGTGISPEINLKQGATNIASGTGNYGFGSLLVGASSTAISFTVENLGTSNLSLSGTPRVAISGTDAAMFVVGTQPGSPVAPAGTTTFTITFSPASIGAKNATVTIANDDLDENPYTFSLTGTGISPEINLKQGATNIASGTGNYGFGSLLVSSSSAAITFTIENLGTSNLNLGGTPRVAISGTDAAMFVVGTQPGSPVAPAGTTTFTITFSPASIGAKNATVTIANDDLDENPYTFSLTGTGISPEINVKQGATNIASGTGSYGFGSVVANTSGSPVTFTIENLGTAVLNLTGTPKVLISGTDAGMFAVGLQPDSPIVPVGSVSFAITFTPASAGLKSATVSIINDDLDESPYSFSLSGTGIVPDINVKQGIASIASGGVFDFGSVLSGTSGSPVTFTIENLGLSALNLNGTPKVATSGIDAAMFVVGSQPGSPVEVSGSTTFSITFSPANPGAKTALVSIASDDPDENPYTFTLNGGGGTAPEINMFQGSTNLPSGGSYGFGNVIIGSGGSAVSFTVENLGTADLNLTGTPEVAISGLDAVMFTVGTQPGSPILPAGNRTFTITFTPASPGAKTAVVMIANDDSDENPYTFSLSGTGVTPEINIKEGASNIISGTGSYGFGSLLVGSSSSSVTFTVENTGTSNLNLSGAPKVEISGADGALFTVGTQPSSPVAPAGTTSFTITFSPTSIGVKNATVSIVNDDLDENPYTFSLTGTGTTPEINVKQGAGDNIASGGIYDFLGVGVGTGGSSITFTIENLGSADLSLNGTPDRVAVSGTDAPMFVLGVQPDSPIAPSTSATFTITFSPDSLGPKSATVTIVNDDLDENPYTFTVLGTGL